MSRADDSGVEAKWERLSRTLSDHRRQLVLEYLNRSHGVVTVGELADRVSEWEHVDEPSNASDHGTEDVYAVLSGDHLPLLEEVDLVEWDRETDALSLTDRAADLPLFTPLTPRLVGLSAPGPMRTTDRSPVTDDRS